MFWRKYDVTFVVTLTRVDRQSCYMVRADELYNEVTQDASGKGASQGMFVGCFVDTATGWVSFTCEGKETSHKFKMEPDTKLFPAIFVEATSKEILQIELGRTSTTLPLSAAVLQNSERHVIPQFPPRLKVQCLKPHQWARVPNQSLQVHALKLSDIRGWSMLCEDAISMLALHIPEEDRCIDILELIEMDKLLRLIEILTNEKKIAFRGSTRSVFDRFQLSRAHSDAVRGSLLPIELQSSARPVSARRSETIIVRDSSGIHVRTPTTRILRLADRVAPRIARDYDGSVQERIHYSFR